MKLSSYQVRIRDGRVTLPDGVRLPDGAAGLLVVGDAVADGSARPTPESPDEFDAVIPPRPPGAPPPSIRTPRLVRPLPTGLPEAVWLGREEDGV